MKKTFFRPTLKVRFVILILLAFIPAFSLSAFNSWQRLHIQEQAVNESTLRLARVMQVSQQQMMDDAKKFLTAVTKMPVVERAHPGNCKPLMNRLVESFPGYTTFGLANMRGDVLCSADPVKLPDNIAGLGFFKETIKTHAVGIGPFEFDRITGQPTVFLGMPVLDDQQNITNIIATALDLSHFDKLAPVLQMPPDSIIVVFDQSGLVLARYPDPQKLAGAINPRIPLLKYTKPGGNEGVAEARALDNVERLFAFTTVHKTGEQTVFLAIGLSTQTAYGPAIGAFQEEMVSLAVVSALTLLIAWAGSDRLVIRKMRRLIEAAERIRTGDLSARSGLRQSQDEVGRLAQSIDSMADAIQSRMDIMQRHGIEMRELKNMNDALQSCMARDEVLAVVRQFVPRLFPGQPGMLYLVHDSGDYMESKVEWGEAASAREFPLQDCWALRRGRSYRVGANDDQPRCRHMREPVLRSYVCVPMLMHGEILGVLHLESEVPFPSQESEPGSVPMVESVAEHVVLTLTNLKLRDRLHAQAVRDGLTGLFNRRYLEETLNRETRIARRNKASISIIMLDIDYFKRFNDTFGHAAGDALLRALSHMLQTQMRGGDLAYRYGGEEFTIVLPDTSLAHAAEVAEKLRQSVRGLQVEVDGKVIDKVSVSLGVAAYPEHGSTWQTVLREADMALLRAKETRNRVVVAGGLPS